MIDTKSTWEYTSRQYTFLLEAIFDSFHQGRGNMKSKSLLQRAVTIFFTVLFIFCACGTAYPSMDQDYLLDLDLEDLMAVEVSSVSKYKQPLLNTPAAVTVIGSKEIRQSGLHEIPELLRLAPGMQVVRFDESDWSIAARSHPLDGERKMLVMADGRSIFSQDLGSVAWKNQGFLIEDIESIEIIRGPGGTSWGYNAVNGVVNITSKSLQDTQGVMAKVSGGSEGSRMVQARFGGKIQEETFYKFYFTGSGQDKFERPGEDGIKNALERYKAGFRVDLHPGDRDVVSIDGAVTRSDHEISFDEEDSYDEFFVKGNWEHIFTENVLFKLLVHYDDSETIYEKNQLGSAFAIGINLFNNIIWLQGQDLNTQNFPPPTVIVSGFMIQMRNGITTAFLSPMNTHSSKTDSG